MNSCIALYSRFVHLEERALDEAEMNDGDFRVKYERVDAMKAQITAREAELEAMSPEERSAVVAQVKPDCHSCHSCLSQKISIAKRSLLSQMMKSMVDSSMSGGKPCCGQDSGPSTIMLTGQGGGTCIRPPDVAGASGGLEERAAGTSLLQVSSNNMTTDEQMRFFQSLSQAPKGGQ